MNAAKRLQRAKVQLLINHPFFGFLSMFMKAQEVPPEVVSGTMGTDGEKLFYAEQFVMACSDEELIGLLAHEVMHCALQHPWRREARVLELWNIAVDYATNIIVLDAGLILPPDGFYDESFRGLTAEQIYELLKVDFPSQCGQGQDQEGQGQEQGQGQGQSQSQGPTQESGGASQGQGRVLDCHDLWDEAKRKGAGVLTPAKDKESMEEVWKRRVAAAVQVAKKQGKLPAGLETLIGELLHPQLPWQQLLRNKLQTILSYSNYRLIPPNKDHLWRGIYLPSVCGETVSLVVAWDTSGSISQEELRVFVSEVQGIAMQFEDYEIHLVACDAEAKHVGDLTPWTELPTSLPGRGGTDFRPVFRMVEEKGWHPEVLVYFTDLLGTFPDEAPPYPVIWVASYPGYNPPFGEVIFYNGGSEWE